MIALLRDDCTLRQKAAIVAAVEEAGLSVHVDRVEGREMIGVVGGEPEPLHELLGRLPGVLEVRRVPLPYARVAREYHPDPTRVRIGRSGGFHVGGDEFVVAAGPCSVESRGQCLEAAAGVAAAGARMLRGGAFKPRTSPYSFQGLGAEGLAILAEARERTGLPVVTEVVTAEDVELVSEQADVLQVGARNMQNFRLLRACGQQGKPVLLKRGMMATIEELLLAAEYVVDAGNPRVILCERGIRTFEPATRNTFDVAAIPLLKERSHLPVLADPSHACGRRSLVPHLARAALAAGADGLLVEVHPRPEEARSDGPQSLTIEGFSELMRSLAPLAAAAGRRLAAPA